MGPPGLKTVKCHYDTVTKCKGLDYSLEAMVDWTVWVTQPNKVMYVDLVLGRSVKFMEPSIWKFQSKYLPLDQCNFAKAKGNTKRISHIVWGFTSSNKPVTYNLLKLWKFEQMNCMTTFINIMRYLNSKGNGPQDYMQIMRRTIE